MAFWKVAYNEQWITAELLRLAVITETNRFGEITPEQYEEITGIEF